MTERISNKVKLLLALGWSPPRVANAIEVSLATLKRYFRAELKARDAMRDRLEARRLEVAAELAFEGNVAAMKVLDRMIERNDLMEKTRDPAGTASASATVEARVLPQGKKAMRQSGAAEAITRDPDLFGAGITRH